MRKIRKTLAMFLAIATALGMNTMNIFAADNFNESNPANSTADVQVTGLQDTTTEVKAYQFLSAEYDAATGAVTYTLADWAKTALVGQTSLLTDGQVDTDKVISALGGKSGVKNGEVVDTNNDNTEATNAILNILGKAAKTAAGTVPVTISQPTAGKTWDATFEGLNVGSYVVLATDSTKVYNPMEISVGLKADDDGKIAGVVADGTVAKYTTIPFDKVITSADGGEASASDASGNVSSKGGDLQVGESVNYKLTGKIPNYDTAVYSNITYKISDTLSTGLTAPAANEITVKVGDNVLSPDKSGTAVSYVTVNGQTISVDLSSIAKDYVNQNVEVTYSAKLNKNATTGFDANTNTAKLTYSNSPDTTTDTQEKKTYTYTFAIDGSVFGNTITNGHELKKTGKGTWTTTQTDPIASEYQALSGAEFTLYSDKDCKNKIDSANLKNDANPVLSTTDGMISFSGLDASTEYYLKETKAPEGYSLNSKTYKVVFIPTYNADGTMKSYDVEIDGVKVVTYTYDAAQGTTPATVEASYTSTKVLADKTTKVETTEIRNTQLSNLPSTGGIGTYLFTIIGVAVMIIAAFMFFKNRRISKD